MLSLIVVEQRVLTPRVGSGRRRSSARQIMDKRTGPARAVVVGVVDDVQVF
jgi:microcompartment protein CcmK/EutM